MNAARAVIPAALVALCAGPPPPSSAVVPLTSGLSILTVVVPVAANLSVTGSSTTGYTASGSLGTTTVADVGLGSTGYNVSVSTTTFDLVGATVFTAATRVPQTAVQVKNTTVTGGTSSNLGVLVALPRASPVFAVSYSAIGVGLSVSSSFALDMTIAIPAGAARGQYRGVVTQTVA